MIQTPSAEFRAEVSPDGRWLAYQVHDAGQSHVVVRPFPNVNDGRIQVSTNGSTEPVWSPRGEELFYLGPSGAVMSVTVGRGAAWTAGPPTTLIDRAYYGAAVRNSTTYDVSPDGKRFLMMKQGGGGSVVKVPVDGGPLFA